MPAVAARRRVGRPGAHPASAAPATPGCTPAASCILGCVLLPCLLACPSTLLASWLTNLPARTASCFYRAPTKDQVAVAADLVAAMDLKDGGRPGRRLKLGVGGWVGGRAGERVRVFWSSRAQGALYSHTLHLLCVRRPRGGAGAGGHPQPPDPTSILEPGAQVVSDEMKSGGRCGQGMGRHWSRRRWGGA